MIDGNFLSTLKKLPTQTTRRAVDTVMIDVSNTERDSERLVKNSLTSQISSSWSHKYTRINIGTLEIIPYCYHDPNTQRINKQVRVK